MIAAASSASGASLQPEAGYGPDPVLPAPHKQLLPTIKIAHAEPRGRRRPGHDKRYAIDPTKLETELGYEPRTDFENGIRQTVAWYLDRADWWRPLRERYDGQRLGLKAKAAP